MATTRGMSPEPSELIYPPRPSWLPPFTALGLSLVLVGLFVWWVYSVPGAIIAFVAIAGWIRRAARESSRLPRRQRAATAVLPAVPPRRAGGSE